MGVTNGDAVTSDGRQNLAEIGVNADGIAHFLKYTSRLAGGGFEAQIVGMNIPSTSTASIIIYALSRLGAVLPNESSEFANVILGEARSLDGATVFSRAKPTSWTTAQAILALMSLQADEQLVRLCLKGLARFQREGGSWTYSGLIDENLIYAIYPVVVFCRASHRYGERFAQIDSTLSYLAQARFSSDADRLVGQSLISKLEKHLNIPSAPKIVINYSKLLKSDFHNYRTVEHTIAPFGLQIFGPALYLLAREFISPDHPFSVYCIKALLSSKNPDGCSWPTPNFSTMSMKVRCTFTTALSVITLLQWTKDCRARGLSAAALATSPKTLDDLEIEAENTSMPKKIFVSYSSSDEIAATEIYKRFKNLGYDVAYAKYDLMVGDSIPRFIDKALDEADYMVLCLSPTAVASKFVKDEIDGGKAKEWSADRKVILPVLLKDCEIPSLLKAKRYANFVSDFDRGFADLLAAVRK